MAKTVHIREIERPAEWKALFPLVKQVNPDLSQSAFLRYLKEMRSYGYRCIGAFSGEKMLGACGFWAGTRFWCGKYMEIDNLVVDSHIRGGGLGKKLVDWVEKEAKSQGCSMLIADSYTHNTASHRFYFREKYIIKGFCFVKDLP